MLDKCALLSNAWLRRGFGWVGTVIGGNPRRSIALSLCLIGLCALGLHRVNDEFSVSDSFTPGGSRAERERQLYNNFYSGAEPYYAQLFVAAKDAGSTRPTRQPATAPDLLQPLRSQPKSYRIEAVARLGEYLLQAPVDFEDGQFTFADLCANSCQFNEPLSLFAVEKHLLLRQAAYADAARAFNGSATGRQRTRGAIKLDFPISSIISQDVHLTHHLYGVQTNRSAYKAGRQVSALSHVSMAALTFRADDTTSRKLRMLKRWELSLDDNLKSFRAAFPELTVTVVGDYVVSHEMVEAGLTSAPYFALGFGSMIVFVLLVVPVVAYVKHHVRVRLWRQLLLAMAVVLSPSCAMLAGFGLHFWLTTSFSPGFIGVPFLVLAVGVDDAFLLINSLQHLLAAGKPATGAQLLSSVYDDVGPSVFITSATNALAFGIGIGSVTTDVRLMCTACSMCITFDLVLQLTLFSPCMLLLLAPAADHTSSTDHIVPQTPEQKIRCERLTDWASGCVSAGCVLLTHWATQTVVLLLAAAHFGAMLYLVLQLVPQLRCRMFVQPHHQSHYYLSTLYYFLGYQPLVIVNAPFDLQHLDSPVVNHTFQLIQELEALPESKGAEWNTVWLRDYINYEQMFHETNFHKATKRPFEVFLASSKYRKYRADVNYRLDDTSDSLIVDSFSMWFSFVIRDEQHHFGLIWRIRHILDKYATLNASLFRWDNFTADQVSLLPGQAVQTVLVTLACMAVVCALTIPSLYLLFCTLLTIVSIGAGVIGWLVVWGTVLDPVLLTCIFTMIGFSVDYTAHVAYHYYAAGSSGSGKCERLQSTMHSVLLPMLQAAASTGVIVIALSFTTSYTVVQFFKSLCLVTIMGVVHATVVLPVLITLPPDACSRQTNKVSHVKR